MLDSEIKNLILKHIVQNIVKYGSVNEKAVMGKLMAEVPDLRKKAKEVLLVVRESINEFEELEPESKKILFEKFKEREVVRKSEEKMLPPLKNAVKGKVIMRFAPNPNGAATLGSARGIIINSEYARMYDGKFILRFDDTDPRTKRPLLEAYDWYLEDCEWLDIKPDRVLYASKRISKYYEFCEKLLEMEKAYPCFCSQEEFRKYKTGGFECPHRSTEVEDSLGIWKKMLEGEYEEGEVVIRIKTDMAHKDPAIRDWVAFRIIYQDHPLVGDRYHVYPLLDFESAIEDYLSGITHILRGKDLIDSERRQKFVYDYFGWKYPETRHWGRVKIHEFGKLSTSSIAEEIASGKFSGWDDPGLPTVRALRRRGFKPEAIKKFFLSLGVAENDVSVSLKNLYAENRKIVDVEANRYFFVWNPVNLKIEGVEDAEVLIPLNPENKDAGFRRLKGSAEVMITRDDFDRIGEGEVVRLKEFCNILIENKEKGAARFIGSGLEGIKKGKNIIHWLSRENAVPCVVLGVERDFSGYAEKNSLNDLGNVVQFERFAFCRIESFDKKITAVYTHP
jgi:glutamyl-tRNA synthetase